MTAQLLIGLGAGIIAIVLYLKYTKVRFEMQADQSLRVPVYGKIEIRIRDNGNGIPVDIRGKILNP